MIFTITSDDTNITIGSGDFLLSSPVQGLEMPGIRTSKQNYSGKDGGRVNAQYYLPRLITLQGFIAKSTCEDHEQARQDLQSGLPIRTPLTVSINTLGGNTYITTGYVTDFVMDYTSPKASRYKLDLQCDDAYFLSSTLNTQTVEIGSGGGFILETLVPILFGDGVGTVNITNNGSVTVYPTIKFTDSATNPVFTNVDTGESIGFNITIYDGDEIDIDMYNRTATLNGGSILSFRTSTSRWWGLVPGTTKVRYTTDSGDDTGHATISWRNAVLTI